MSFDRNVFINCPFDQEYRPLLRPLLFTVLFLGFRPRIALESLDSGTPRIGKIIRLIEESRYAIHDLSRIQAKDAGEFFRLNMPFELGIDVGCRLFHPRGRSKRCLVLEAERYRYQAALSDLSGSDICMHRNSPEELVDGVRNWLNSQARTAAAPASRVWGAFLEFMSDNSDALVARGFSKKEIANLPIDELISSMVRWCRSAASTRIKPRSRTPAKKKPAPATKS